MDSVPNNPETIFMIKKHFKLAITESAYYTILDVVSQANLTDPLPSLNYNNETKIYEISTYSSNYLKENQPPIYQVGRLKMIIESSKLLDQVNGRKLDYLNGNFIIS